MGARPGGLKTAIRRDGCRPICRIRSPLPFCGPLSGEFRLNFVRYFYRFRLAFVRPGGAAPCKFRFDFVRRFQKFRRGFVRLLRQFRRGFVQGRRAAR